MHSDMKCLVYGMWVTFLATPHQNKMNKVLRPTGRVLHGFSKTAQLTPIWQLIIHPATYFINMYVDLLAMTCSCLQNYIRFGEELYRSTVGFSGAAVCFINGWTFRNLSISMRWNYIQVTIQYCLLNVCKCVTQLIESYSIACEIN